MSMIRYNNPWNLLDTLQREIYPQLHRVNGEHTETDTAEWTPSVDISEDDTAYTLHADIPGVNPADIEISMDKGVLTIKGERKTESKEETSNFRRVERVSGSFVRRFTLPDTANADAIEARSEHGVVTITIPKQEQAASRRIEVKH